MENGRLFRILCKIGIINERPEYVLCLRIDCFCLHCKHLQTDWFLIRHFRHMTSMFLQDRCVFAKSTKIKKKTGNVNDPVWFPSDSCPLLYRFTMDPSWSETGDRYLLKLFRDYLFHQVTENGAPWVDLAHIVACLNKVSSFGNDDGVCGNLKVLSPRSN